MGRYSIHQIRTVKYEESNISGLGPNLGPYLTCSLAAPLHNSTYSRQLHSFRCTTLHPTTLQKLLRLPQPPSPLFHSLPHSGHLQPSDLHANELRPRCLLFSFSTLLQTSRTSLEYSLFFAFTIYIKTVPSVGSTFFLLRIPR
jgi:hypothetical protein